MKEITTTKKIILCGTSLTVNVTKEAQAIGASRGDYVEVTIRNPQENAPIVKTCNNCGNCRGWIDEGYGLGEYDCKLGDKCPEEINGVCPGWIPKD